MPETLKKLVVDQAMVTGTLHDFPVLIEAEWTRLRDPQSIVFLGSDQTTVLSHEIRSFDPDSGGFSALVRVPAVSDAEATVLYLACRDSQQAIAAGGHSAPDCVWDDEYRLVGNGTGNWSLERSGALTNAITVEAWVSCDQPVAAGRRASTRVRASVATPAA